VSKQFHSGVIEGPPKGKTLNPIQEKGLITYPFPQYLEKEKAQRHLGSKFVFPKDDDTYALAQMWTVNYNDEFRKSFVEAIENPDPEHFSEEAVKILYDAVAGLFGDEARGHPVKYCTKSTQNIQRTYVGTPRQLKRFLDVEGVKESMGIESVVGNEVKVRTLDKKGNKGTQSFTLGDEGDVEQVLYKRNGFTSFMCIMR